MMTLDNVFSLSTKHKYRLIMTVIIFPLLAIMHLFSYVLLMTHIIICDSLLDSFLTHLFICLCLLLGTVAQKTAPVFAHLEKIIT